jgi:hypothetical protein
LIASFLHNFIFLKTRKVGGTSLEIVLSSWCGEEDICSPLTAEDEILRQAYGGAARNHTGPTGEPRFYNHMPADEVRRELPELWDRAFKFAVERHPYDKVVSRAWWAIGRNNLDPGRLGAAIDSTIGQRYYLNYPIYMIDGRVAVDDLWPYEDAWARMAELAGRLGVPIPAEKPRAKAGYRPDRRGATDFLTKEQRDRIRRDAQVEFDLLGYEP